MKIERISSYKELNESYVPEQYKGSSRLLGVLSNLLSQCDNLETTFTEISDALDMEQAEGVSLDYIGGILGVSRIPGESDSNYLTRIKSQISITGIPSMEALRGLLRVISGAEKVGLYPVWPAGMFFVLYGNAEISGLDLEDFTSGTELVQGTFLCCEDNGPFIADEDHGQPFVIDGRQKAEGLVIDGLIYRTAVMPDGREWMVENLQAVQGSATFYDNDEATYGRNGKNYGRLYNWNDAVAVADRVDGWHLPTSAEWDALANAVGGTDVAGARLKAVSGWSSGNGTDNYGFSGFPAGARYLGSFYNVGSYTDFWTATEYSSAIAYHRYFSSGASMGSNYKSKADFAYSVRLVKDI